MTPDIVKPNKGPSLLRQCFSSPWAVLIGGGAGIYVGFWQRWLVEYVSPVGEVYLNALKMCILPILMTAIAKSLGRIVQSKGGKDYIKRMIVVLPVLMFFASALGLFGGIVGTPGANLNNETRHSLGALIFKSKYTIDLEMTFAEEPVKAAKSSWNTFLTQLIPGNIFQALSQGQNLQILIFSILFGLVIGYLPTQAAAPIFSVFESIYLAFEKIVQWLMLALPIGLFCLLSGQFSGVGTGVLVAMLKFLSVCYAEFVTFFLLTLLVIWLRARRGLWDVIKSVREPIMVAFGTWSSLACIPASLHAMGNGLHFHKNATNLVLPLGINTCRFGNILYFSVSTIFISQLYQVTLEWDKLLFVLVASVLAGIATAGATGVMTLSMLGLVLTPLGLPLDAVLVLLIIVDPMIDPLRTLTNVMTNCAATAIIVPLDPPWDGQADRRFTGVVDARDSLSLGRTE